MLGKHSTTKLHPWPYIVLNVLLNVIFNLFVENYPIIPTLSFELLVLSLQFDISPHLYFHIDLFLDQCHIFLIFRMIKQVLPHYPSLQHCTGYFVLRHPFRILIGKFQIYM
jgi:hypothetical protein